MGKPVPLNPGGDILVKQDTTDATLNVV